MLLGYLFYIISKSIKKLKNGDFTLKNVLIGLLIFLFPILSSESYEEKPLILDKSYVKVGYGVVHLPDNNNVSQGVGDGAIDNTFPKAKYDFKYDSGSTFSIAAGNRFQNFAFELSIDQIVCDVESVTSDTAVKTTGGDISLRTIMINALYYPDLLKFGKANIYLGAGIGITEKVDLDESGITGSRAGSNTFKSSTDLFNPTYQFIIGGEYNINNYVSLYTEVKNATVKSVHLARGSSKETYGSMEMNPMTATVGIKFSF